MGMTMLHDMSLTKRYAIVYDFPVTVDVSAAMNGVRFPFRWNPDYGSRVGLLPREAGADAIVWIDAPLCYSFHPLNAYDTADGRVVVDLCVYDSMFVNDLNGPFGDSLPRLERWTIDPARRAISTTVVDATPQEFPRHANAVGTTEHRYGYATSVRHDGMGSTLKHDLKTGARDEYVHGPGVGAGEAVFVAREGSTAEDDGWLLTYTHGSDGASSFVVLDAQDITRGPVASVVLPQRVPYGFHGNWVSDRAVPPPA
jgi:carotenoid cleavage dioxygenase